VAIDGESLRDSGVTWALDFQDGVGLEKDFGWPGR